MTAIGNRPRPTTWRALIVALLHRRPETRGVSPLADVLDEWARWGA